MFLLDTNVVSEFRRLRPHGAVIAWFSALSPHEAAIPAVVLGELQIGVERTRRTDPVKAAEIDCWIDSIETTFRVVPMSGPAFRIWARFTTGHPQHLAQDAMIAATALADGLIVATRNTRDFVAFGVPIFDPFVYKPA